jgi:hypothetical protein
MRRFWLLGPVSYLVLLVAAMTFSAVSAAQVPCSSGVCVTTWHNDNLRTGQNTNETQLTQAVVKDLTKFGKICTANWPNPDNSVYAQPLVVPNVMFHGQSSATTVVYVATMSDTVYAIDGRNCAILGSQTLREPGEVPQNCLGKV